MGLPARQLDDTERRIQEIIDFLGNAASFDFSRRLPAGSTGDALDALAETANLLIETLETSLGSNAEVGQAFKAMAIGEIAGSIAHEVNNPLAIIIGKAQQLARRAKKGEASAEGVVGSAEKIEQTGQRIAKIIRALQVISKSVPSSPYELIPLKAVIDDALTLCEQRIKNFGVELKISDIPAELIVKCRPGEIARAVLNLLQSSFGAVGESELKWISLDARSTADGIEILVSDSSSPSRSTGSVKASGRILKVVSTIAESHGGRLDADAASSVFRARLWLPREPRDAK